MFSKIHTERCSSFETITKYWSDLINWRSLVDLGAVPGNSQKKKPVVVAINGCFDVFHAGHAMLLRGAAAYGTHLVVGLNSDTSIKALKGPARPICSETQRRFVLESNRYVSKVHVYHEATADNFLIASRPDFYFKTSEHAIDTMIPSELAILQKLGTKIVFLPHLTGISTSIIIQRLNE